ncbi:MAG: hypothetical protein FWD41_04795, partial [Actinomycetia bacterium]|nr:hypothetical protein [Actinomycetes bacterium]
MTQSTYRHTISTAISGLDQFAHIKGELAEQFDSTLAVPGLVRAPLIATLFERMDRPFLVIAESEMAADRMRRQLAGYLPPTHLAYLPDMARAPWDIGPADHARTLTRAKAFAMLQRGAPVVVVTSIQALMRKIASPSSGIYDPLHIQVGEHYDLADIAARLVEMGYARSERATDEGIFTLKGDTLHIHPALGATPVRIEFFDDEVEAIKRFIPSSGQVLGSEDEVTIFTMEEVIRGLIPQSTAIDYGAEFTITILLEPKALFDGAAHSWDRLVGQAQDFDLAKQFYRAPEELDFGPNAHLSLFSIAHSGPTQLALRATRPEICSSDAKLVSSIRSLINARYRIIVALPTRRLREKVTDLMVAHHLALGSGRGQVDVVESDLTGGYIIDDAKLALITTAEAFPRFSRIQSTQRTADLDKVKFGFEPGDYVVHRTYGVALFKQMTKREVDGIERDCLQLEYAMGDTLYTPIDQLDKITKYVGSESGKPKLTRLGTKSWLRATKKARESAKKLAFDLIDLYARRAQVSGFEYAPDSLEQIEMEALFEYEETPDQLAAIDDVKADMESS